MAGKYDLAYKKISEVTALAQGSVADTDYIILGDVSVDKPKKVLASAFAIQRTAKEEIVYNVRVTLTLAQVNAGAVIIPAVSGTTLNIISATANWIGTWAAGTTVELEDTNATPVVAVQYAQAQMDDAVLVDGMTGATRGAGIGAPLTADKGLAVEPTGSDFTGGTSVIFNVQYTKTLA